MTELPSVVPVLQLMVGAGGSTGDTFRLIDSFLSQNAFLSCFEANLNGEYFSDPTDNGYYRGIIWELWLGDYSLKETKMMIRPAAFKPNERASNIFPPDP